MGQQIAKEHGSPAGHGRPSSGQYHGSNLASSSSFTGLAAASAAGRRTPSPPPPLPPHLADDVQVDRGGLVPQGVYTGPQDYDQHVVRQAVVERRLAPFCKGSDDEETYENEPYNSECPICFLYYPSPLNFSRCCHQPICTECFVQMKRADPNHANPPSSEARSCPFCVEPAFGVTYTSPSAIEAQKAATAAVSKAGPSSANSGSGPESLDDASHTANFAERAIGTGGAAGNKGSGKKKVLAVDDPDVITVDQVRPDWHVKLAQAEATIARRANRRVIMRQVGDRLIPIGISSSRAGADLAAAAEDGRINMNGPGGSIILQERPGWASGDGGGGGGAGGITGSSRRRGRGSRSEGPNTDLARLMRLASGEETEEMMLMEAMRLSLVDHEEQQKREAEAAKKQRSPPSPPATATASSRSPAKAAVAAPTAAAQKSAEATPHLEPSPRSSGPSTGSTAAGASSSPASSSFSQSQVQASSCRASQPSAPLSSAAAGSPPVASSSPRQVPVPSADYGLSATTMADLSELIEGAAPPPAVGLRTSCTVTTAAATGSTSAAGRSASPSPRLSPLNSTLISSPRRAVRNTLPTPEPVPVLQPVIGLSSALDEAEEMRRNTSSARQSLDKHDVQVSTFSNGSGHSTPYSSPPTSGFSRIGAGTRTLNPKNPFRRSMGEGSSS